VVDVPDKNEDGLCEQEHEEFNFRRDVPGVHDDKNEGEDSEEFLDVLLIFFFWGLVRLQDRPSLSASFRVPQNRVVNSEDDHLYVEVIIKFIFQKA
jgi:hypothetical protein